MTRRGMRAIGGTAVIAAMLAITMPAVAATFGAPHRASARYAWNPGKSLATTDSRLLSIWASDCPPPKEKCATDDGPHMGVFVQRSPAGAVPPSWSKALRLSPASVHAERPSIAAAGTTVIASWVTQRSYSRYRPGAPRVLWVRVSHTSGRTWRRARRLSSSNSRVDYPRVAIGDDRLFAVWTSADNGAIRIAHSDDRGGHWAKDTVGRTTSTPFGAGEGYAGLPDIGASGANVAIAWISTDTGIQRALTSAASGDDFVGATPVQLTGRSPNDRQHYPAVGGAVDPADPRVAIAYSTRATLEMRTYDGVALGAPSVVFTWQTTIAGTRFDDGYGPAVLPLDPAHIAVAVAGCRHDTLTKHPCDPFAKGSRIDVLYVETPDGGTTWGTPLRLTDATRGSFRTNDEPSVAITGTTRRVGFDRYQPSFSNYAVWVRSSI
ncbi:MAG: hypothetical protein ABJB55_05765 [Actinomycetota bacterium]